MGNGRVQVAGALHFLLVAAVVNGVPPPRRPQPSCGLRSHLAWAALSLSLGVSLVSGCSLRLNFVSSFLYVFESFLFLHFFYHLQE